MPTRLIFLAITLLGLGCGQAFNAARPTLPTSAETPPPPPPPLPPGQVRLAWDPVQSTATEILAGYKIYVGFAPRTYTTTIDVGNVTTAVVSNLQPGQLYYFAVTAYSTTLRESDYSNEVNQRMPQPIHLRESSQPLIEFAIRASE